MDTEYVTKLITPQEAADMLVSLHYKHQRDITPAHVDRLAEEMSLGDFEQETMIKISVDTSTGSSFLVDGQHRLSAVVKSGKQQVFVIQRRYRQSFDQIGEEYYRTDRNKTRGIPDFYTVLELHLKYGITKTHVRVLGQTVDFINGKFSTSPTSRGRLHDTEREIYMDEYADALKDFIDITNGAPKDMRHKLERRATCAVALVTLKSSRVIYGDRVADFWQGVAYDDGLKIGDPRKVCHKHLLETGMSGGGAANNARSASFSARYVAGCFNAYVQDKTISFIKPDVSKPIVILGSQFA